MIDEDDACWLYTQELDQRIIRFAEGVRSRGVEWAYGAATGRLSDIGAIVPAEVFARAATIVCRNWSIAASPAEGYSILPTNATMDMLGAPHLWEFDWDAPEIRMAIEHEVRAASGFVGTPSRLHCFREVVRVARPVWLNETKVLDTKRRGKFNPVINKHSPRPNPPHELCRMLAVIATGEPCWKDDIESAWKPFTYTRKRT